MDENDTNVFKETTYDYYILRPDLLEEITYVDYFKKYEIILKTSKRKLPIKSNKFKDKKG